MALVVDIFTHPLARSATALLARSRMSPTNKD